MRGIRLWNGKLPVNVRAREADRLPNGLENHRHLGPYRLKQLINTGGEGVIVLAQHRRLGRVALKICDRAQAPELRAEFEYQQELTQCRRPGVIGAEHILKCYDYGEIGGFAYFAMEVVDGVDIHTLRSEFIQRFGRNFTVGEALSIAFYASRGLSFVEQCGRYDGKPFAHGDPKLENMMLNKDGVFKWGDFRFFATRRAGLRGVGDDDRINVTPLYAAPELWVNNTPTVRSDIYALGMALYYMLLSGSDRASFPFAVYDQPQDRETMLQVANWHIHGEDHHREFPEPLQFLLSMMIAKRPEHRFANHVQCARAIEETRSSLSSSICTLQTLFSSTFPRYRSLLA